MRCLIVGNRGGSNVGECLERAAPELGVPARLVESRLAMEAPMLIRRFNWWIRGRRPTRLDRFSAQVVDTCREWAVTHLLTTGLAPVTREALDAIGHLGVFRVNYLTDDPWNPAHRAGWFLRALAGYEVVYSPRRANLDDLRAVGCRDARYLPFAYAPRLHYPERAQTDAERRRQAVDVVFVGGADAGRARLIGTLAQAGFSIGLYGSYWGRYPETRNLGRGQVDPATARRATSGAKVALCLVRRSNRDGHVMRSLEIGAIGACMLAEDTAEHRELFGEEGEAVRYFRGPHEMVEKLRWLLAHADERWRLAAAVRSLIVSGAHTYRARLATMLGLDAAPAAELLRAGAE